MLWLKPFTQWGLLFIQLITVLLAIRCWHKAKSVAWKIFFGVWILTFLIETAGKIMGAYSINNFWLYNYFFALFYPGIVLIYTEAFAKSKINLLAVAIAVLLVIWAVLSLISRNHLTLNTLYNTVAGTVIIFFALIYLSKLFLDKETATPLSHDYYYWFSIGFIIYFSSIAVMVGMHNRLMESKTVWLPYFMFYANHLITFVLHICLWMGFSAAFKWMK